MALVLWNINLYQRIKLFLIKKNPTFCIAILKEFQRASLILSNDVVLEETLATVIEFEFDWLSDKFVCCNCFIKLICDICSKIWIAKQG